MKNYYINLNQIKSNPDGQTTVNRQSRLMSYRGNLRNLAMIFAVLVMSIANIGMAWGTEFTFSGVYNGTGNGSWNTTTATTPIVTVSKSISNTSKQIYCVNAASVQYPSLSNKDSYIKFSVPSGYRITNVNVTWMSNTNAQKIIALFGESLSAISSYVVTATNGGYVISNAIANSGSTNCNDGYNFAISSSHNAKEVMLVRGIAYDNSTYSTANTKYGTFPALLGNSSSGVYTHVEGSGSAAYIGKVVLTVEPTTTTKYTLSYDANGGTGTMPSHEFAAGTTVYAAQNAGFTAPSGKIFKCWNTKANGSGTSYSEWASFSLSANTTLYAQWITASTSKTYCISLYNLNVSDQMKYFTYSGYDDMQILDLEVPNYKTGNDNNFWVGAGGSWKSGNLGNSGASSANEKMKELCLKGNRGQKLGTGSQGVLARFFIYDNSTYNNLYIEFTPKQYSLIWGPDGSSWSPVKLYPSGCENEWTSEVVTLTSDQISSYKYYVGTLKADNGVAFWYKSKTSTVGSMGTYNKRTKTWGGNVNTLSAGAKGFFRMWQNATGYDNWRCHFVPVYTLSYNANGGEGAPASAYTATEGDAAARTLKVSMTEPTRNGYSFEGWATSSANASAGTVDYASGASITLSADQELWVVWTPKPYTITLNGNGGSGNTSSVTATYNSSTLSSSITNPTLDCYTFDGWYSGEGGSGTLIINTSGVLQASTTYTGAGGIWTNDGAVTLYAKWSKTPTALTVNLGGDAATPAGGSPIGTEYTLTCSASTGVIASYQWKQNTSASTTGAVNAEGTGATTASFSPNPAAAGTYYYYCVATDACGNSVNTDFSGAFQFNAAAYTVTYNKNGDGAGGAGSVTGTVPSDATSYTSGQRPVVKGPGDLAWDGHTFIGWNDKADGSGTYYSEKANFAISASKILYAQWRTASSCPGSAGGTVFSLSMNNKTSDTENFSFGDSKNLASYATITNGNASFTDIRTATGDTKATITKANPALIQFGGAAAMLAIYLDCPLQDGDQISFTGGDSEICFTASPTRVETIATSSKSLTISTAYHSSLIGKKIIYIWRKGTITFGISALTITRPASVAATITATRLTPEYMPTGATGVQIGVDITGASTGWYYRVKKGGGYETPDNTTYTTTTWTMTSTIGAGANTYTVELYNGSGTKMAESNAVTVTGETGHPMTILAGANGTVSPSGLIYANGEHLHPEITATPASGYHFVSWTKDNENATLADASSATTTITNASGACTITANFEADDACPTEISGGTVYKLQIKTGLTNGNLASTGTTTLTTANYLSEAITNGSASVTSPSAGNAKIADTKAICLDNGSAYITLNLDCPIQEHDIIKYTITQQNGGLYKAATRSDGNLLLQLTKTANSSTVGQIEVASGSKLIGKTTLYLFAKSNGAYNYYFEIIRPIKITLDATTNGGTAVNPIYGATDDKVVLQHAFKSGSRFNGWYTAASGGTKQADYYTITTGTTLFAQFTAGCAVTGTMFSLSFPSSLYPASNTTVPANSSMNLLQYATITGGAAIAENTNSSAKGSMQTNGKFVLDDSKVCVHITLDCPLQLNDVITTTIETQNLSYTATSTRNTTNYFTKGTNQTTTITADHVLLNSRDIYIWTHSSSGGKLISINISRPVGTKYSVTYDGNDMTSGSEPTDANEYDPADEVTTAAQGSLAKTNYTFGGWNTANDGTGTNTAAGSTFSITDNTTLYAKWTQAVTLDGTTNGGSDGSATAVWNATALTGITHATPAAGYKLIGYYTTATDEPTTGVKVLNASGTFSSTTVADYITSGKWSRTGEAPTLYARYEASAGLTWNLTVNAKIDLTTESKTSDYPQVGSMTDVATNGLSVSKSAKANLTSIIQTVSSLDPDKYVKATFVVASGYKFTPSKIKLKVQPKDNAETIKVVLTDGVRTYEHDFGSQSAGSIHSLEATNADADKYMQGTVTLKIYAYGNTTGYRLGTPITIEGAVTATCDMPTYTSVDHGATEYQEGDEAESLSVVGGAHVNTYQWYWNTANDRSDVSKTAATAADGTGYNTYTFTPQTTSAYSRYYWCELTATDCGTIKTEAVGITVTEVKTSASIDWTDPVGTVHYGGGGYTIKATVKETTWAGGPEDLTLSAPAGIRIYNVTRGTTDSKDWIQANFDVQTSFDRETYSSSIPFVVSAPAQTGWDAINDEHGVTYDACAGGGGEGSAFIEVTSGVTTANTGMSNYWEAAGVGRLNKAYNQAMVSSADAQTIAGHAFSYRTGANNSNWMVNTYIAGVTKIRLYFYASAAIASAKLGISKVLYDTEYFNSQGSRAVVFDNVATSADSYAAADKGWIEFTLPEMAANSYCYFATNTGNLYIYGVELFSGSVGTGGTETTNLTWSNGTVDGGSVTGKTQSSANFTITATRDAVAEKSLGAITYSSSNTSCATVDSETGEVTITATGASELTTTITATLAASGCYKKKEITYTLTIPGVTCSIETGTLTSDVTSKCSTVNATLTLTGFESGASIQWYKGESTISDDATYHITNEGTTSTLVTKEAGTYSVMVSKTTPTSCSDRSNSITISNASASASATKIVDSWYVKNGRLTPDIELWSVSEGATLGGVAWSPANETGLNCVLRDGIVYLEGKEPNANESGADKVYTLTLTLKDACGGDHEEITKTITITHQKNTDKHVLAFVVNGTKNGGFTAGISADQTTNLDLYKKISAEFDVLATNAYATDDEKALKQYYSQFDILCITDYPNTGEKGNNKKSYIDAMGSIVDIRPILTMEAFVAKWGNWKAKDISGTPHSPDPRQYAMDLQCKDHEIFDGTHPEVVGEGDEAMYRVTMVDATKEDYATLDGNTPGTDAYDADDYPALQGFEFDATMAADGLLPLGQIYNGSPTNTLQVGIERQTEMSARLMVLGIQQLAMERLTADGQTVVINALKYLMKKNEEEIADCSVAFVGGAEDGLTTDWNNDANWSTGKKPDKTTREVRILAPVVITNSQTITSPTIKIADGGTYDGGTTANGSITINAGGALKVKGEVVGVTAPAYSKKKATDPSKLVLNTSETAQSALILDNENGMTRATVNLYSLGRKIDSKYQFQYYAVPMEVVPVNPSFAGTGIYTYVWHENGGWERRGYYTDLYAFEGIGITTSGADPRTYEMTGNLASTADKEITLTKESDGENIIGNSWTAPINIASLVDAFAEDENVEKVVYIYITGNDNKTGSHSSEEVAGKWLAIPIDASGWPKWTGQKVIPAMQAFYIKANAETTLTLNYDEMVRTTPNEKLNSPLKAPRRAPLSDDAISLLKLRVEDSSTHTDLYLFEGNRFSDSYDNGWEAKQMGGDGCMQLYAQNEADKMAVLATDELEGTVVGFEPGKETGYTISFSGEGNGYYLNDIKLRNSVRISEGETYTFTYEKGDAANRFYISRTAINAPEVATGMENLDAAAPRVQKIIYNDKLYIIRGGRLYDATGKVVK